MLRLAVPIALLAAILVAVAASDRSLPRADFVFINRGDISTMDPQRVSWMQDIRGILLVFEPLVRHDPFSADFRPVPGVARSWDISSDGSTYTFHFREDARWSNGQPVRPADFIFAWRRALLPDTACDYTEMFRLIKGAAAFYDWRTRAVRDYAEGSRSPAAAAALWAQTEARFAEMVSLRAPDDHTLVVELEHPTPYFLDLCGYALFCPVYPPLIKAFERLDPATGRITAEPGWTKPPHIVGNGPFNLTLWRFQRDMRWEKNPHYWNRDSIALDSIAMPTVNDPSAAVLAFRTGAVDWVSDVVADYRGDMLAEKGAFYAEHEPAISALRSQGLDPIEIDRRLPPDPRKNIHAIPAFGTYFYNFNCSATLPDGRANPFADPRIRRAFAMAVDKPAITDRIRRAGEPVATTLIPPGSIPGYRTPRGLPFDPDAARSLLAECGYPGGRGFITVEILFNKDSGHDLIAQSIARDWQTHLGVSVRLVTKEIKVFREDQKNHNFMVCRAGWYGDYGDPTTFLDTNRTGDGNNDRNYSSPRYDDLMRKAALERDPAARMALLEECERILVDEDLPLIPIYHYVQVMLFDPNRVANISAHPRQEHHLYLVDVREEGMNGSRGAGMQGKNSGAALEPQEQSPD